MKLLTLCLQLLFQPNKYTWLPWHFMPLLLSGQNDISDPKLKPMIEGAKPNWLSAKHWSHHKIENPKTPRSTLLHKQSTWRETKIYTIGGAWVMKPNQWCEISTLISQHRKPIIPGATATGPMTDAITKLKLPPSCLLQTTFGPQKPTWKQTKYKLPLDHRANMDTGQVQITFGPEEPTRVQVKSYHLWATKSNQRIKTDIEPQYRAEFDEFCNFNAWTKYIRKTQASVKKVRSDKETTCNNCPGVYCVKL